MADKVKGFGRRGVENLIAEFRLFGAIECKGGCGFKIECSTIEDVCGAFNIFQFEHVTPKSLGGSFERSNHAVLCGTRLDSKNKNVDGCNQRRGNSDAAEFYSPEMLDRIKTIQAADVDASDWESFKTTYATEGYGRDFTARFPPSR
jgi:hypothetical protein